MKANGFVLMYGYIWERNFTSPHLDQTFLNTLAFTFQLVWFCVIFFLFLSLRGWLPSATWKFVFEDSKEKYRAQLARADTGFGKSCILEYYWIYCNCKNNKDFWQCSSCFVLMRVLYNMIHIQKMTHPDNEAATRDMTSLWRPTHGLFWGAHMEAIKHKSIIRFGRRVWCVCVCMWIDSIGQEKQYCWLGLCYVPPPNCRQTIETG